MSPLSRRQFVATSAAALGASCLGSVEARAEAAPHGGLPIGMHSWYLRAFPLEAALARLQELGLHSIEASSAHYPQTESKDAIARADALFAQYGVRVSALGGPRFGADHEANTRFFWFARLAGVSTIVAEPDPEGLDSVERLARQFNIRVLIHNRFGARYQKPEDSLRAAEGRDRHIGFVVDTGQYLLAGVEPVQAAEQLAGRLDGVHIKDQARMGADAPPAIVGEGKLDVVALLKVMRKAGFRQDGLVTLEYETGPGDKGEAVRACLANMDRALAAVGWSGGVE